VRKCHYIHHILLSTLDPPLYAHLISMDVAPNLYILRWYRLMLCREFHLEDTMTVWDVIFAVAEYPDEAATAAAAAAGTPVVAKGSDQLHSNAFVLTEFMCISMLLYVRSALLLGDNTFCLRRLLRYPPVEDIRVLLARALKFLDSWKRITSDPTLTREVFDPTKIEESEMRGTGSEENGAFDGPWHSLTEGMGADAPLEGEPAAPMQRPQQPQKKPAASTTLSRHSSHPASSSSHSSSGSSVSSAASAKALLSDGFSSLKSFMKGAVAKAGEVPTAKNDGASTAGKSTSPSASASPPMGQRGGAHQQVAAPVKKAGSNAAVTNSAARTLPKASGISHFLSPTGVSPSPPPPSSSSSASSQHQSILTGPTAKEHDELVLLRKALRQAEKERDAALQAARASFHSAAHAQEVVRQMGALMEHILSGIQREWEESTGKAEARKEDERTRKKSTATGPEDGSSPAEPSVPSPSSSPSPSSRAFSYDILLSGLAELKSIKDVLMGRLQLGDVIEQMQASVVQTTEVAASDAEATSTPAASTPSNAARAQLLQDMAQLQSKQPAAPATNATVTSAGASANGSAAASVDPSLSFPYNIPPSSSKKFAPLFEPDLQARDAVSELFALDEADALPGVYVPKATSVKAPTVTAVEKEQPKTSPTSTAAAPASSSAPLLDDPLVSPIRAKQATAVTMPTPAAATAPAVSAATKQLLSSLLTTPPTAHKGSGAAASSLFDAEPAAMKGASSSSTSLFDSSPPDSPFGPTGQAVTLKKPSSSSFFPASLDLDEDDSIRLPSSKKFKQPAETVPKQPKATETNAPAKPTPKAAAPFRDPLFDL
jgi:hypothetical protein